MQIPCPWGVMCKQHFAPYDCRAEWLINHRFRGRTFGPGTALCALFTDSGICGVVCSCVAGRPAADLARFAAALVEPVAAGRHAECAQLRLPDHPLALVPGAPGLPPATAVRRDDLPCRLCIHALPGQTG